MPFGRPNETKWMLQLFTVPEEGLSDILGKVHWGSYSEGLSHLRVSLFGGDDIR